MPLKLSVTHIRVLVISVNLVLTVMLGAHAVYRLVYNREYAPEDGTLKKLLTLDEKEFQPPKGGQSTNASAVLNIQGVGDWISPPPAPPAPPPQETPGQEEKPSIATDGEPIVEEGGPLEEKWEYVTPILFPDKPRLNRAVLAEKSKTPATRVRSRTIPSRTTGRSSRQPTRTSRTPIRRAPLRNTQVVYKYDRWLVDEKEGLAVWIVDVTDREVIYEEEGSWRRYKLVRKNNSIWNQDTNEVKAIEAEDATAKAEEEETPPKKFFHLNADLPDPAEVFANRKLATPPPATGTTASSSTSPAGSRVTNRYSTRSRTAGTTMTPEERRRQAIEKMRELKNLDRSKLSPEDRKGLEQAEKLMEEGLRGRGARRR